MAENKGIGETVSQTMSIIASFAPEQTEKSIIIKNDAGIEQEFTVKRFTGIRDYTEIGKKIRGRLDALKAKKNKLPVIVTDAQIESVKGFFPDAEVVDGKTQIYLTDESEVQVATHLEMIMVKPIFSWSDAAIFSRIAGSTATKIIQTFNEFNTTEAIEEAKNE